MKNNVTEPISHSEWEVMRIVWTLKSCTSSQVIKVLDAKQDWKPSTVKTLLSRLIQKNFIKTDKVGRGFIYKPNIMELEAVNKAGEALFSDICAKDVGKELSNIIDKFPITKTDTQKLIDQLQAKLESEPDEIDCCCLGDTNLKMDC